MREKLIFSIQCEIGNIFFLEDHPLFDEALWRCVLRIPLRTDPPTYLLHGDGTPLRSSPSIPRILLPPCTIKFITETSTATGTVTGIAGINTGVQMYCCSIVLFIILVVNGKTYEGEIPKFMVKLIYDVADAITKTPFIDRLKRIHCNYITLYLC